MESLLKSCLKSLLFCLVVAGLSGSAAPQLIETTTYHVDASKPPGGDGLSWATAFNTIQNAVDAYKTWTPVSLQSYRIWVKEGTYVLSSELNIGIGNFLYGGFPASIANPTWADRDWKVHQTIIDGNKSVRCVMITRYAILDGFIIQNGNATLGAGIYLNEAIYTWFSDIYYVPIIRNCWIRNNTGGGLYDLRSDTIIEDCEFSNNLAGYGGAIRTWESGTRIIRCQFHSNQSTWSGGAIHGQRSNYVTGNYFTMTNCLFHYNTAGTQGGAIYGHMMWPLITNCTFAGNQAAAGGAYYGAINAEGPRIRNSIFWGNTPDQLNVTIPDPTGTLNVSFSNVEGGWTGPGTGNINQNPLFAGATNYRLRAGSPCIDAGSNAVAPDNDLDGQPRPQDGNGDGTARADMGAYEAPAIKSGTIFTWGLNDYGQLNVPSPNLNFIALAGGGYHSLGLKRNGTIIAWGRNTNGQCNVPSPNSDYIATAGGRFHSLGLKNNGSITAWGQNTYNQCNVPSPNTNFVAIAGGDFHSLGLKNDGSIIAWGRNDNGQCNIPAPNAHFVAVAAGGGHSLGLKSDGTIIAWGNNSNGQRNVPAPNADFVAVAAGRLHSLGLKRDGTIVAWGYNYWGQCNVPAPNANFVAVASGWEHSLGIKGDGSVVAWGRNTHGQCNVPTPNADFAAVAGIGDHSLGIRVCNYVLAGDLNNDCRVNLFDYGVFGNNWMNQNCIAPDWCDGADLNKSSQVDIADLAIFVSNWLVDCYVDATHPACVAQ